MNADKQLDLLHEAKGEAQRFIKKADAAIEHLTAARAEQKRSGYAYWSGSVKEFAAAKRSSMDLTRVLADLRRTWR
jgi:hypothetical protein